MDDKKIKLKKSDTVTKKKKVSKTKENVVTKKTKTAKTSNEKKISKSSSVINKDEELSSDSDINLNVNENNSSKDKKSFGSLVLGIILLIVLVAVFIISKILVITNFKEVSYDKYINKIKEMNLSVVYIGNNSEEESILKSIADNKKIDIYYINSEKLNDDQKNSVFGSNSSKSMLFITYDGVTNIYFGDYNTENITNALVDKKILSKGLQKISVEEYLSVIKSSGYHFMFVGSDSCSWCSKFKPVVEKISEDYMIDSYYVDLSSVSEEDYYKLVASNNYFSENNWGTPTSFIYKDGESLTAISGYKDESALLDILRQYSVVK